MKDGLRDLSISRTTFGWGIPVPEDASQPGAHEGHVMYVWLDALTNYLTAVGYPDSGGQMAKFWPASLHMVGKDILRFHAICKPRHGGVEPPPARAARPPAAPPLRTQPVDSSRRPTAQTGQRSCSRRASRCRSASLRTAGGRSTARRCRRA